jgi:hypothetical protein
MQKQFRNCNEQWLLALLLMLMTLAATGCGKSDWGYMSGKVLLNGQPIGPGMISLERVDGQGAGAMGLVDTDGNYTITSARKKEGAAVGEYRVTINPNLKDFGFEQGANRAPIPARYANADTSGLSVNVERGRKQFDFELKP